MSLDFYPKGKNLRANYPDLSGFVFVESHFPRLFASGIVRLTLH